MRALLLALPLAILTLWPGYGNAGDARPLQIAAISDSEKVPLTNPNHEMYRGYYLDLSQIAARGDFSVMAAALRHQLDIIESVGLSPRVLNFFHTVPILVDDAACLDTKKADNENTENEDDKPPTLAAACYGLNLPERVPLEPTVVEGGKWTNPDPVALAEDTNLGVVQVRPIMLDPSSKNGQRPILLHEMFHAYHAQIMPRGERNPSIKFYYLQASNKKLYPADAYLMTNEKEFFAVTASVLASGMADGGTTPQDIKQKQPGYFKYLSWLLEIGLDGAPSVSPVASTN
jgi:hypothetical protein